MPYTKKDLANAAIALGFFLDKDDWEDTIPGLIQHLARQLSAKDTPCNVSFVDSVDFNSISTVNHIDALFRILRKFADIDRAPCFGFSITQKEKAWKIVNQYIEARPGKYQTIVTPSRHGNYKVMWVVGRADNRRL